MDAATSHLSISGHDRAAEPVGQGAANDVALDVDSTEKRGLRSSEPPIDRHKVNASQIVMQVLGADRPVRPQRVLHAPAHGPTRLGRRIGGAYAHSDVGRDTGGDVCLPPWPGTDRRLLL